MGTIELQVFVSLIVVLGAAFAALICDFLKGNVEQLREANLELRVRQDERERQQTLGQQTQRSVAEQALNLVRELPQGREQARESFARRVAPSMRAPAAPSGPAAADARSLFEGAGGGRRRGRHNEAVASWANELLERKKAEVADRARAAEKQPVQASAAPPAAPAPASAPAPEPQVAAAADVRDLLKPAIQASPARAPRATIETRAETPAIATPAAPALPARVPEAKEPIPQLVRTLFSVSANPIRVAGMLRVVAAVPLFSEPTPLLPSLALRADPTLPIPQLVSRLFSVSANPVPAAGMRPVTAAVSLFSEPASLLPSLSLRADPTLPVLVESPVLVQPPVVVEAAVPVETMVSAEAAVPVEPPVLAEPEVIESSSEAAEPRVLISGAIRIRVIDESALFSPAEPYEQPEPEIMPIAEAEPEPLAAAEEPVPAEASPVLEFPSPLAGSSEPEALAVEPVLAPQTQRALPSFGMRVQPVEPIGMPFELGEAPEAKIEVRPDPRGVVVKLPLPARTEPELMVPSGLRGRDVLDSLMAAPEHFTGMVLSVGVVDYARLFAENGKANIEQVVQAFEKMLLSLTRDQDMLCRPEEDEWLILCPREMAASAQRRTTLLSERIWDFQLRSLGGVSILFSWGAAEGMGEPLQKVVTHAHEEMALSRRTRRGGLNLSPRSRRRVVNG